MTERQVQYSVREPRCDRVHHVGEEDIRAVLSRLPVDMRNRLNAVHFNDRSRGGRTLGYVNRGRREIALCALPPRMSLTRFLVRGQTPLQFGATRGRQWPAIAIRRFMLYDVFLHELGHLQIINDNAKSVRRKFAMETRAQQFAMYWCKQLWSQRFEHADLVHSPPTQAEIADPDPEMTDLLRKIRQEPDDPQLYQQPGKLHTDRRDFDAALAAHMRSLAIDPNDPWTNLYAGECHYQNRDYLSAIRFFTRATEIMPHRAIAWCFLGDAHDKLGDLKAAVIFYTKAQKAEPSDRVAKRRFKKYS